MNKTDLIVQALGAVAPFLQGHLVDTAANAFPADAVIVLGRPGHPEAHFRAYARRAERRSDLAWHANESEPSAPGGEAPLLIAPYVSAQLALECQQRGINFLDTAGNAHIDLPGLYVHVMGRPRPRALRYPAARSALRKASTMRVIFALMADPDLVRQPVRSIAEAAGVALGSASAAIDELKALGFLAGGSRDRRIADRDLLSAEWARQYPISLRDKLRPQRYAPVQADWQQSLRLNGTEAVWGGEMAAAAVTGHLAPVEGCIYSWLERGALLVRHRLRPDPAGSIEVLDAFWRPSADTAASAIAPLLLVYADLVASNDGRNLEVARLLEKRWKDA
ncbi:type IV toxin-antitoxin system AbiEi family antitoxin [Acidovorax sp. NCPPB 4044]|uniref:type IV toxin-antitoxin system AbiEi family antitoxin n=1 Tax=Acidovorax sp. NCPPB 4044 TaxID=2940490 RepID=UPI0023039A91|nr:type IV toxin-antitoxin system AbiEi family antitoxin [Acidovorax sp. NCPPB 4044]MDA8523091.1 type IV toxin-antitoxin system AbiEi family antitoxin [Acidovorax sp. NCPPB 4044]